MLKSANTGGQHQDVTVAPSKNPEDISDYIDAVLAGVIQSAYER